MSKPEHHSLRDTFIEIQPDDSRVAAMNFYTIWSAYYYDFNDENPSASYDEFWKTRYKPEAEKLATEASHVQYDTYAPMRIETDDIGDVTLWSDGFELPLREVYNPDGEKQDRWESGRRNGVNGARHRIEYAAFKDFEQHIGELIAASEYKDGDTYVWVSPPPTHILCDKRLDDDEKLALLRPLGYDFHSNTPVFTLREGPEGRYIEAGNIQSYLHPEEHIAFLNQVTGESHAQETDIDFLSSLHRVTRPDVQDPEALAALTDHLYGATPKERKLVPPQPHEDEENASPFADREKVEQALADTEEMLFYSYCFLIHLGETDIVDPARRAKLVESFTAWKNAFNLLVRDEADEDLRQRILDFQRTAREDLLKSARIELANVRREERSMPVDQSPHDVMRTVSYEPVAAVISDFARMDIQGFDPACGLDEGWGDAYGYNYGNPRVFGFVPTHEAARAGMLNNSISTAPNPETVSKLKSLSFKQNERITTIPCPGCGECVRFKVKDVQKQCKLDCCSKENGTKGKMTDPCGLIGLLKTSIPDESAS